MIPKVPLDKQIRLNVNGDEAVAYAAKQCLIDVVAAYPITPQTIIVEKFSEFVANGEVHTEFIAVESEHSAMSACIGAAAAGARAFTSTSAQGLALMVETLYIASGLRLPIVMALVNRALSAPINIHCDHSDAYLMRDSGWIQLFVENVQEAYDTTIQAFRIGEDERVQLPVAVNLDGFFLSHTMENIYILPDDVVHEFIGGYRKPPVVKIDYLNKEVSYQLNPAYPLTIGPLDLYDYYFEHKIPQIIAMENALSVIKEVNEEWFALTGRRYGNGLIETTYVEDADVIIVIMGSSAGTVKQVVKKRRGRGEKIGVVRIRSFRPFPYNDVAETLRNAKVIVVMDRGLSFGSFGPLYLEINASISDLSVKPMLLNYIYGLGGRDLSPEMIERVIDEATDVLKRGVIPRKISFVGVRE
ncbi:MAG: pyruvate ferredoxin oxidoreductase [Desulfurococcaceae archaeon]